MHELLKRFAGRFALTVSLVVLEAAGWVLFPLVIGRAIDSVLAASNRGLYEFAVLGIATMGIAVGLGYGGLDRARARVAVHRCGRIARGAVLVRSAEPGGEDPVKPGTVTIAGRMSKDLAPGTWKSILRQAGLKTEDTP